MNSRFYDVKHDADWSWSVLRPGDTITLYHGMGFTLLDLDDQKFVAHGAFLVLATERTKTHHGLTTLNVWLYAYDTIYRKRINEIVTHKVVE